MSASSPRLTVVRSGASATPPSQVMTAPCWCCAMWGVTTPGTRQDQGMEPGWLCDRCRRHQPVRLQ